MTSSIIIKGKSYALTVSEKGVILEGEGRFFFLDGQQVQVGALSAGELDSPEPIQVWNQEDLAPHLPPS